MDSAPLQLAGGSGGSRVRRRRPLIPSRQTPSSPATPTHAIPMPHPPCPMPFNGRRGITSVGARLNFRAGASSGRMRSIVHLRRSMLMCRNMQISTAAVGVEPRPATPRLAPPRSSDVTKPHRTLPWKIFHDSASVWLPHETASFSH